MSETTPPTSEELEFARTLVKGKVTLESPRETVQPPRGSSTGGKVAIEGLRNIGGPLDARITVERTLGEGGMGIVHLATQTTLGRHVAVKTLRGGGTDPDATLRILREAWVTGALEHPNIVPVYDVGVDAKGAPVIVMKRVEGRAWSDVIADADELARIFPAADPLEANIRILLSVCNALEFAHSRGILHRDVKPENVMIGSFGEVYVLDWGIAVSLREDASGRLPTLTHATEIAGTPAYMAPEMLVGDPAGLSPRTDVYLLGAIFYEIFANAPPHRGTTHEALASSILVSKPVFSATFPSEARQICRRAMSRDASGRYASVEEFRKAIEDYLAHRGSRKIAFDAKRSLDALLHAIEHDQPGEERTLAIFNLLGECRFGYRAALSAWEGNTSARRGLDRALLAVVEHELKEGDPRAAATLLREVTEVPDGLLERVDAATKARAEEEERLRKLEKDLDASVGSRTRSFIGTIFGVIWVLTPLVCWGLERRGIEAHHWAVAAASAVFLALAFAFRAWARESLTKTLLNRRISSMLGQHLALQIVLSTGAWLMGLSPTQSLVLLIFSWALSFAFVALWIERWFAASSIASAVGFLLASARPDLVYPIMAVCNLIFTFVLVRIWMPKQDMEALRARRDEFRQRARKVFLDASRRRVDALDQDDSADSLADTPRKRSERAPPPS